MTGKLDNSLLRFNDASFEFDIHKFAFPYGKFLSIFGNEIRNYFAEIERKDCDQSFTLTKSLICAYI